MLSSLDKGSVAANVEAKMAYVKGSCEHAALISRVADVPRVATSAFMYRVATVYCASA